MALTPCAECGVKVSTNATACPQCGASRRKPTSLITKIIASFFALSIAIAVFSPKSDTQVGNSSAAAPKKPADPEREAAFQRTVAVVSSIKSALREPTSVQWESIARNEDASIVCVAYRARNGFGGMGMEQATYANKKISTSAIAWNKNCAGKSLIDERKVRFAL